MKHRLLLKWIGIVLTATGTVFLFSRNGILSYFLNREMSLSPSSKSYELWRKSPIPVVMDAYLFNCTNPGQLLEKNYRPEFVQMGPYRFKQFSEKVDIAWNPNHTVTYRQVRRWYFDHENSNGSLNDNATLLNVVPVGASFVSRYWNDLLIYPISGAMRMFVKTIWATTTVSQILFDGFTDPLLRMASSIPGLAPVGVPADKIGFFYGRNGSALFEGVFNMETGTEDITKLGILSHWNYKNHTSYYDGGCAEVRGSAGELFSPGQTKLKTFEIFLPDMCRTVQFEYLKDVTVNGITGYRYVMSKKTFDNGTSDPGTLCNCGGQCLLQGVLNVSACRNGAPAFVSNPHFFDADPYYVSQVDGLQPDADKHQFYITLEPVTGAALDVAARIQLNLMLQPNSRISMFAAAPKILFPMMWFETRATLTSELAASIRTYLQLRTASLVCSVGLLLIGLLILGLIFLPQFVRSMSQDNHPARRNRIVVGSGTEEYQTERRTPPEEKYQTERRTPPEENTMLHAEL